jgi:hypothetical protein
MLWRNSTGLARTWKTAFLTAAFGGFLLFGAAGNASAHDFDKCQRRIDKEEWKLQREINRHGFYSRQAEHQRHELREARERCRIDRERWEREHHWRDRDRDRDRY